MTLDLFHLASKLTDIEFAKTIISSGDFFPGFYRFTMGSRNYETGSLSVSGLTSAYFQQISTEHRYTRSQWTDYTNQRHQSQDTRNSSRSDSAVYDLLDKGYLNWMTQAKCYDIAVIEIDNGVEEIAKNQSYFFMGSLIRFSDDGLQLGVDLLRDDSLLTIPVNIDELIEYTHSIYGIHLKDFFLPSDIVASLTFENDIGNIHMTDLSLSRLVTSAGNSIVIASNREVSKHIPIRWAKDIILTEVVECSR